MDNVHEFDGNLTQGAIIARGVRTGTEAPIPALSIDAAIANASDDTPESDMNKHRGLTFNNEVAEARKGDAVFLFGAKSHAREGRVIDVDPTDPPVVDYVAGSRQIRKAVLIRSTDAQPFSQGGDSGSLIIDANNHPVAILIGADPRDPTLSVAQDLLTIQSDLKFDGVHSVP